MKLDSSGFSYNPLEFEKNGISVNNFYWDSSKETPVQILRIVKKIENLVLSGSKVLIHCHSGTGRTGVVIACYLIFVDRLGISEAIKTVKQARERTFESITSVKIVEHFDYFLAEISNLFPRAPKNSIEFIENQNIIGINKLEYLNLVPVLVTGILKRCAYLKERQKLDLDGFLDFFLLKYEWTLPMEMAYGQIRSDLLQRNWQSFEEEQNIMVLAQLLRDWIEDCSNFLIDSENILMFKANLSFKTLHLEPNFMKENDIIEHVLNEIKSVFEVFEYRYLLLLAEFLTVVVDLNENNFDKVSSFIKYLGLLSMNIDSEVLESENSQLKKSALEAINRFYNLMLFLIRVTKDQTGLIDAEYFEKNLGTIEETHLIRKNTLQNTALHQFKNKHKSLDRDSSFLDRLTVYEDANKKKDNLMFKLYSYLNKQYGGNRRSINNYSDQGNDTINSKMVDQMSRTNSDVSRTNSKVNETESVFDIIEQLKTIKKGPSFATLCNSKTRFEKLKKMPNPPRRFSVSSKIASLRHLDSNFNFLGKNIAKENLEAIREDSEKDESNQLKRNLLLLTKSKTELTIESQDLKGVMNRARTSKAVKFGQGQSFELSQQLNKSEFSNDSWNRKRVVLNENSGVLSFGDQALKDTFLSFKNPFVKNPEFLEVSKKNNSLLNTIKSSSSLNDKSEVISEKSEAESEN